MTGNAARSAETLDIKTLVRLTSPAVVTVELQNRQRSTIGAASGFLISPDGILVTNHHVIRNAHYLIAHLDNGAFYTASRVFGFNCDTDLVVLQLSSKGKRLPFLQLGHTKDIEVGERVIAIGSPMGLPATVSEGIISGSRRIAETNVRVLQTTAAISRGSSGGPLIRRGPEVVGVTTFGALDGQNLNFAIPSEYVVAILRNPNPTSLRTAGASCEDSPFTTQIERQQSNQSLSAAAEAQSEAIGSIIALHCEQIAKSYQEFRNCTNRELAKVQELMAYLEKKTKTSHDAANLYLECNGSWSRHGRLWKFTYFKHCLYSEISRYRLHGPRKK